jgi:MerR family copper efflux transcriptional regulator
MNIGEAAAAAGLTVKTVRYYSNIELVRPKKSTISGYRDYSDDDVAKLKFVGTARRFDFSVAECRDLLGLYEDKSRTSRDVKRLTEDKIAEIDVRLAELSALRAELQDLAGACDGDDRPDCPILDGLAGCHAKTSSIKPDAQPQE